MYNEEEGFDEEQYDNLSQSVGGARAKNWLVTQERAMDTFDRVCDSTNIESINVFVKSKREKQPIQEFINESRQRLNPYGERFSPTTVADDAISVLEGIQYYLDSIRQRFEDSFRSLITVNEDMNEFIKSIEQDKNSHKDDMVHLKDENQRLRDENEKLKEKIKEKDEGFKPIADIVHVRSQELIKLFDEFKKTVGTGKVEEMEKYLPLFEKEIEITKKLINIKQKVITQYDIENLYDESSGAESKSTGKKKSEAETKSKSESEDDLELEDLDDDFLDFDEEDSSTQKKPKKKKKKTKKKSGYDEEDEKFFEELSKVTKEDR